MFFRFLVSSCGRLRPDDLTAQSFDAVCPCYGCLGFPGCHLHCDCMHRSMRSCITVGPLSLSLSLSPLSSSPTLFADPRSLPVRQVVIGRCATVFAIDRSQVEGSLGSNPRRTTMQEKCHKNRQQERDRDGENRTCRHSNPNMDPKSH